MYEELLARAEEALEIPMEVLLWLAEMGEGEDD